jgi:hypothetical protein
VSVAGDDEATPIAERAVIDAVRAEPDHAPLRYSSSPAMTYFEQNPTAVRALLDVAGGPMFEHRVAQLRQDRESACARARAETGYAERGFTILEERPSWRDNTRVALRYLRTSDAHDATTDAVTDPARWAVLLVEDTVLVDATTGEPVDEADVDWTTQLHPYRTPAEDCRHASTVLEQTVWEPRNRRLVEGTVTRVRCRDPYRRWTFQRRAVGVERRPVHRLIACAARPRGVPTAAEAGLMTYQHLAWAKTVSARAVCGWPHYPRA